MNAQQVQDMLQAIQQLAQRGAAGNLPKITPFKQPDPAAWRVWRRRFTIIAAQAGWANARQKSEIAAAMEDDASRAVQDIDHTVAALTPAQLLDAYEARFIPQAAGAMARGEFRNARQLPSETVVQWHTRAREVFLRAHPGQNAEDSLTLIDTYVEGLADPLVRDYVMDHTPNTFAAALQHAETKYANVTRAAALNAGHRPGDGAGGGVNAFNRDSHRDQRKRDDRRNDGRDDRRGQPGGRDGRGGRDDGRGGRDNRRANDSRDFECWLCGRMGHRRHECDVIHRAKEWLEKEAREGRRAQDGQGRRGGGRQGGGRNQDRRNQPAPRNKRVGALDGEEQEDGEQDYYSDQGN